MVCLPSTISMTIRLHGLIRQLAEFDRISSRRRMLVSRGSCGDVPHSQFAEVPGSPSALPGLSARMAARSVRSTPTFTCSSNFDPSRLDLQSRFTAAVHTWQQRLLMAGLEPTREGLTDAARHSSHQQDGFTTDLPQWLEAPTRPLSIVVVWPNFAYVAPRAGHPPQPPACFWRKTASCSPRAWTVPVIEYRASVVVLRTPSLALWLLVVAEHRPRSAGGAYRCYFSQMHRGRLAG